MFRSKTLNRRQYIDHVFIKNNITLPITTQKRILLNQLVSLLGHFIFEKVKFLFGTLQLGLSPVGLGRQIAQVIRVMLKLLNKTHRVP